MEYQEFNTKTTNKYLKNYHIKTNQDAIGLHDEVIALEKDVLGVKNQNKYTLQKLNGEKLSNLSLDTLFANHVECPQSTGPHNNSPSCDS